MRKLSLHIYRETSCCVNAHLGRSIFVGDAFFIYLLIDFFEDQEMFSQDFPHYFPVKLRRVLVAWCVTLVMPTTAPCGELRGGELTDRWLCQRLNGWNSEFPLVLVDFVTKLWNLVALSTLTWLPCGLWRSVSGGSMAELTVSHFASEICFMHQQTCLSWVFVFIWI